MMLGGLVGNSIRIEPLPAEAKKYGLCGYFFSWLRFSIFSDSRFEINLGKSGR
jgi:hypothetical protein